MPKEQLEVLLAPLKLLDELQLGKPHGMSLGDFLERLVDASLLEAEATKAYLSTYQKLRFASESVSDEVLEAQVHNLEKAVAKAETLTELERESIVSQWPKPVVLPEPEPTLKRYSTVGWSRKIKEAIESGTSASQRPLHRAFQKKADTPNSKKLTLPKSHAEKAKASKRLNQTIAERRGEGEKDAKVGFFARPLSGHIHTVIILMLCILFVGLGLGFRYKERMHKWAYKVAVYYGLENMMRRPQPRVVVRYRTRHHHHHHRRKRRGPDWLYMPHDHPVRRSMRSLWGNPNQSNKYMHLANYYSNRRKYGKATVFFQKALALKPDDLMSLNNFAWMLCTAKETLYRNPKLALILALRAYSKSKKPYIMDTLAEAYYSNGMYKKAFQIQRSIFKKHQDALDKMNLKAQAHYKRQLQRYKRAWRRKQHGLHMRRPIFSPKHLDGIIPFSQLRIEEKGVPKKLGKGVTIRPTSRPVIQPVPGEDLH